MGKTSFYDEREFFYTSESVSEGHPDKICDQISDAVLDAFLKEDPYARVAVETMATTNRVMLAGEVRGPASVIQRVEDIARGVVKQIGYEQKGFHHATLNFASYLHAQSADIARGVDNADPSQEGAGDQGLMFGYACNETPDLMPAPIYYSHKILRLIFDDIHSGKLKGLGPDAKSQITLKYKNRMPVAAHSVVLSIQHHPDLSLKQVKELVRPYIEKALPKGWMPHESELYINPTGQFIIGGPDGDAGLTGRKIIVDTYGGAAPHGGGAFSGKDPTKVDRSAAYAARYVAKNVVAAGIADACTIQVAYAIGVAKPLAIYVDMHNSAKMDINEYDLSERIRKVFDFTPWGLRQHLQLHRPIYQRTAAYGHFGRTPDADGGFSWEKTDLVDALLRG